MADLFGEDPHDPKPRRPGDPDSARPWRETGEHKAWLRAEAARQFDFFAPSLRADGGFAVLAWDGTPLPRGPQELHSTTRMVHSFCLGHALGRPAADKIIDAGLDFLWSLHRDPIHGGYLWSVGSRGRVVKLAYGHVFVLLAASSARMAGHPDADRLLADIADVLERRFWDEDAGLFRDELSRDWTPFSTYRGMNANMHGVEALLAAFEATGEALWLERAGRILEFFTSRMAADNGWRIPEHYRDDWSVDPDYAGDPMFRPAGTTPGHSLEFARLILQHWDLSGRPETDAPKRARKLAETALADGWLPDGGLAYTLDRTGKVDIPDRYWWPVTEGIGAMAALQKAGGTASDETWYRRLWTFADAHFIDHERGGWYPELDASGAFASAQFAGKPDIYHALQATLYPLLGGLSRHYEELAGQG